MRKGFSVFTPMAGTLIILITMLIVSSIILSERVAVQGSVKSYRSSELVNIAAEAQSRVIESVRSSITASLEDYSTQGEPVMSIFVDETSCPNAEIAKKLKFKVPKRTCGVKGKEIIECEDPEEICWGNSVWEVNATASNQLMGKDLLGSSIEHLIKGIVSKYGLIKVTSKDVEFGNIVKNVGFKDCNWDECSDGRITVVIDFAPISETPIAEISSEGKRLQVFMPAEQRVYTTHEPFMQYARLTAKLFSSLQLLNNTWHNAGNDKKHDENYERTDGSEWYHYNYAIHNRYRGSPDQNSFGSEWAPGFYVPHDKDNLHDYFNEGKSLSDYIIEVLMPNRDEDIEEMINNWPDRDKEDFKYTQSFRFDRTLKNNKKWSKLLDFVSGYAAQTPGLLPTLGIGSDAGKTTVFPGGCIDAEDGGCKMSGIHNCIVADDTFDVEPYQGSTELVNTTESFDDRFTGENGMASLVKELKNNMNNEIIVGMGMNKENLHYKLVVNSTQYYVEGNGFKGKDNWHCGQFLTLYQVAAPISTDKDSNACEATRKMYNGGLEKNYPVCTPKSADDTDFCDNLCEAEYNGKCPWFISEPVNWTCDSLTLYRVEEIYRLYRSTPENNEPNRPVFAAEYTRIKDDYNKWKNGEHNYTLWINTTNYDDIVQKDSIEESWDKNVARVRSCTYTYSTHPDFESDEGSEIKKVCEWITLK